MERESLEKSKLGAEVIRVLIYRDPNLKSVISILAINLI